MPERQLANLVLEQSNDLIWIIDANFCLKYANQAYQNVMKQVTGEEKKMDEPIFTEGFGGYFEKWKVYFERGLKGEHFEIEENFYNPHTNQVEYSEISFKPLTNENQVVVNVACQSRDITSFKKSNAEAQMLLDASLDVICSIDEQGNFTKVNAACKALWGYEKQELIGKPYISFVIEEDVEKTNLVAADILAGKVFTTFENRYKRKDGGIAFNLWSARWDKKTQTMFCVARDAKEKKEEEQRLKLLESVITNTNDSVLITEAEPLDEPGPRILYVNEAFTKVTGYTAEEVIGKSPRILQGPKSDKAELARLSKALRNWEPCEITTINYKKNGEEFWINMSISPVADEKGWYTHWISIERDVTEQKTKEIENELVAQISSTFNLVNDFEKATKKLCEIIGLHGKLDWVELWTPNLEMTEMRLTGHYVKTPNDEIFYTDNYHNNKFAKDEGLTGKVWASGKQLLLDDVSKSKEFIRADSAKKIGLKSVLGIPLIFNNEVLGVLTIGVKSSSGHLKNFTRIFERLEKFIGSELQRKTIEIEHSLLFDTIPDIISVGDFQGRFLRINNPGCELLGYSENEILQKGFENFIHPEDLTICYKEIQKLQNGQDTFGFEVRFITKAGEILWLSWYCKAKINEGLIYCTAKNITEEKKLRELNRQANGLAKVGSWEYDLIKDDLFWSPEVYHLHDMEPGTFVPNVETAIDFYKEEHKSYVTDEVYKSLTEGVYLDYEAVIISRSKKEKWVRVIGSPEFIDGKCVKFIGYFQDTTEHREAEMRLQSLSDNLPGVVFQYVIYPDGTDKLLHVTDGAELIWGFSTKEAMENNQQIWKQIEKGGDLEQHKKSIEISIETKSLWKNKYRYVMPNNEIRTHLGYGSPTFLADGTIVFNSVILDITEEAKNEELLKQTSKIARVGSWEVDLINNAIFWSDITHEIHETSENFKPELSEAINFYRADFRELVTEAVTACIETGTPFDFEAIIVTHKNNEVWVRSMGRAELVDGKCARIFGSFQDINTRKLAELNQLKLIEEKNKILESIGDAFFAVDNNWVVTYWNQSAESVLGKKKEDIVGENLWNEFADAIDTDFYTKYHYAMKNMETQSFEAIYETTNQWIEVTAYPSADGLSVYFKDITQRKIENAEIAKSEEKRMLIMNGALDAIITIDTNETITFWNAQAEIIFGWKAEEVMGKLLSETIIPESFRKYHVEGLKNYLKTGEGKALNVLLELSALRRNKEEFPIELTVIPIKQGGEEFFCAFIRDITQRKKAEREITQANDRFEKVTKATNDAIYDWNIKDNTLYWGGGFNTLFGYDLEKISPSLESWSEHIHPEDLERVTNSLNKVIESDQTFWTEEYRFKREDGIFAHVIDRGIFIKNSKGESLQMVGSMTDISERKHHEVELLAINEKLNIQTKELQRSNEELEQFAFITSHDLQEPLRMITSFMDQLQRKYSDRLDEKGLKYIYYATDGAKRMRQIIQDLLLYSRANKPSEQNEWINLNEIVSEYTQLRRKVIAEKKATITFQGLPSFETYRAPVTQIFHSLLDNALKYVDENKPPRIEISALEKENVWQFAIKDNGIGIDQQFFDKVFIIFQRLQNRKEHDGNGIGLAIAKRSIEFLGGEIWLESEVDKGSTFYFTILKIKNK